MSPIFSRLTNIAKSYLRKDNIQSSSSRLDSELRRIIEELNSNTQRNTADVANDFFAGMPNNFTAGSQSNNNFHRSSKINAETEAAFRILDIGPDATNDEIRSAFKQKIRKFHPDNLHNATTSEQKKFNDISRDLIKAYNLLKKERNL